MTAVFVLILYMSTWASQGFGPYGSVADCEKVAELAGAVKPGKGKGSLNYACVAIPGKQQAAQTKGPAPTPVPTETVPAPAAAPTPAPEEPKSP